MPFLMLRSTGATVLVNVSQRMKKILSTLVVALTAFTAAQAQQVKWIATNALPSSLTNAGTTVSAIGVSDGAGTTAWLVSSSSFFFPGFPGFNPTQQVVWLNKSGGTIFNGGVSVDNAASISSANLLRVSRTDLLLQIRGTSTMLTSFNILRRYVVSHSGVTFTDTALDPNENAINSAATLGIIQPPPPDKTGFFTVTLGLPTAPEIVVRRYSNK